MLVLFIIFVSLSLARGEVDSELIKKGGKCKHLWRPEKLVGKCFGLHDHQSFAPELKDLEIIQSANQCRAICCNLGEKCVSWQYHKRRKECKLGGVLRLGREVTGTPDWCDPMPPMRWSGKRLISNKDGQCAWGEELPTQCFGLGDERLKEDGKTKLSMQECEEACCAASKQGDCDMWQHIEGRGCFYNSQQKSGIHCAKEVEEAYEGGRKCIPNFCGGLEDKILGSGWNVSSKAS